MSQRVTGKRMQRIPPTVIRSLPLIASICALASRCSLAASHPSSSATAAFLSPLGSARRRHGNGGPIHHRESRRPSGEARMKRPHVGAGSMRTTSRSASARSETERKSDAMGDVVVVDDDGVDPNRGSAGGEECFDEGRFAAYERAIEEVLAKRNVVRDFKKNEEDLALVKGHLLDARRKLPRWGVRRFLPSGEEAEEGSRATEGSGGDDGDSDPAQSHAKRRLRERSEAYMDATGLDARHHKLATTLLGHLADHCAKNSLSGPLHVAWEKVLEAGLSPLSRTLSTYLYVLGLEGDGGGDDGASDSGRDVVAEVAMFHDALYEPTEKTITLLVKSLVKRGDAAGAEALLAGVADGPLCDLRHRTTSPILKLYCERGEIDSALRLYHTMRTTSRVKMDAATYADFVAAVAENGYFGSESECIAGAGDLGYGRACGPELFDALITEMAEDVLDISEESAGVLRRGFASGFEGGGADTVPGPDGVEPMTTPCGDGTLVAHRVAIDEDTARCPATGAALRLIVLEPSQRVHVHDTLLKMAREKSMEYTARLASKGRSTRDNIKRAELASKILGEFSDWLDARPGEPFTAVVDGANVAYFGWGKINVHQLVHMVNALERRGERPLVVFPEKYTWKKFHLRQGMFQHLKDEELELLEGLKEKGQMYVVPPMCLDDLYWMLASVSNQTTSSGGRAFDVPKNDAGGRHPGPRPIVISNDMMRDHKMDLLEERAFRRWCCSHIVNYRFDEFVEDQREEREIRFHAADVFSDEIQGNPVKCGEGEEGRKAWHFPVSEWDDNERFCLRLPA